MNWINIVAYFFGGIFLANAIPHAVSGMMGRKFQSPFADPPGQGLSSATLNVCWGFLNLVIGYLLIAHVGNFEPRAVADILPAGLGALVISLFAARHFGKFHGGSN